MFAKQRKLDLISSFTFPSTNHKSQSLQQTNCFLPTLFSKRGLMTPRFAVNVADNLLSVGVVVCLCVGNAFGRSHSQIVGASGRVKQSQRHSASLLLGENYAVEKHCACVAIRQVCARICAQIIFGFVRIVVKERIGALGVRCRHVAFNAQLLIASLVIVHSKTRRRTTQAIVSSLHFNVQNILVSKIKLLFLQTKKKKKKRRKMFYRRTIHLNKRIARRCCMSFKFLQRKCALSLNTINQIRK